MNKMQISLLSFALFGAFVTSARADGFQCESVDGRIHAKVYNHTSPRAGTRKAAIFILSDATNTYGDRTIASFKSTPGELKSYGALYVIDIANTDLEEETLESRILGTPLGELDSMEMNVLFSYGTPLAFGVEVEGTLTLVKRDGSSTGMKLVCTRYLKHY